MTTAEYVATYKGRPVTELTRDELIEAYTRAARQLTAERESQIEADKLSAELAETRRKLRLGWR